MYSLNFYCIRDVTVSCCTALFMSSFSVLQYHLLSLSCTADSQVSGEYQHKKTRRSIHIKSLKVHHQLVTGSHWFEMHM